MSDLSPETRDLLARGRGGAMPAKSRALVKRRVLAQVAAGTVVTTTATAAARVAVTKLLGVASVLAVVGAGSVVVSTRAGLTSYPGSSAADAPPPTVAEPRPAATTVVTAAVAPPTIPPPAQPATAARVPTVAAPATPRSIASRPAAPARPSTTAYVMPPVSTAPAPYLPPPPPPDPTVGALPPVAAVPNPPRPSLEEDARLLREAHASLAAGDAAGALRLLDAHAARFPTSSLEPERSAERVFALCLAGRSDEARRVAAAFVRVHPEGPLARRVRASCGGHSP